MPLYDEDGKEVEGAMTPEEIDAKVREAQERGKAEAEAELDPLKDELETKKTELIQARADLEKEKQKDKNFSQVRDKAEKLEKVEEEIKTLKETITAKETKATELETIRMIKEFAGDDEKLAEKIKFHYSTFDKSTETPENKAERIQNATKLAGVGSAVGGGNNSAVGSGGGKPVYQKPDNKNLSEDQKDIGKKLGLLDEELK